MTAAVVTDRGSWAGAVGRGLDGSRLRPASDLAIGSVTKTFTAAEVLRLVAQRRVDLARRVSAYIPLPTKDNGASVHELLTMRSGFRDYVDQPLLDRLEAQPHTRLTLDEVLGFVPTEVDKAGAAYEYINTDYLLLGQLIERVTGVSYATALHRDLLDPAGLADIVVQDEQRSPEATGLDPYLPDRATASAAWSAGSMVADAPSVARWGYLVWGGRLPDADCFAQMPARGAAQYGLGTEKLQAFSSNLEFRAHRGVIGDYQSAVIAVRGHPVSVAVLTAAAAAIDPMPTINALVEVVVPRP